MSKKHDGEPFGGIDRFWCEIRFWKNKVNDIYKEWKSACQNKLVW